jgi:hypothetical protein
LTRRTISLHPLFFSYDLNMASTSRLRLVMASSSDNTLSNPYQPFKSVSDLFAAVLLSFRSDSRFRNRTIDAFLQHSDATLIQDLVKDLTPFGLRLLEYVCKHQALPPLTSKELDASYMYNCANIDKAGNYAALLIENEWIDAYGNKWSMVDVDSVSVVHAVSTMLD